MLMMKARAPHFATRAAVSGVASISLLY